MINDIHALFEKYEDEYSTFDKVENKRSKYKDLHAFLLLEELFPDGYTMIDWAGHDEIAISPNYEELAAAATEEQILELIRCGLYLEDDSLKFRV